MEGVQGLEAGDEGMIYKSQESAWTEEDKARTKQQQLSAKKRKTK